MLTYLVTLSGEGFQPSTLTCIEETQISVSYDAGSVNRIGKKESVGYICVYAESIDGIYGIVNNIMLESSCINSVEITVNRYFNDQCNLEFSKKELELIVKMSACLNISCVENAD